MKWLVCVSKTVDTNNKVGFSADGKELDQNNVQFIMNPYDEWYALVRALELKETLGGTVTLLNVGKADNDAVIRKGLALGADEAVRINADPGSAAFVAKQIAEYARDKGFDGIFCGKETTDYNGAEVGAMVAEYLDLPFVSLVTHLDLVGQTATVSRDIEGGEEVAEVDLPFVLSAAKGLAEQRIANMKGIMTAKTKQIQVLEPVPFDDPVRIAQYTMPPAKSAVRLLSPDQMDELVRLLHEEAKVI